MAKLIVKNLSVGYKENQVIKNIDFEACSGEITCLCGLNGCGKSTLLTVLTGLADRGLNVTAEIMPAINEETEYFDIYSADSKSVAKKIAFMMQSEYSAWDFSVFDFVLAGRYAYTQNANYSNQDRKLVSEILEELNLDELADRSVLQLSGGEFQRVRLARALVQQPSFLILDEPANNLDFVYEAQFLVFLKKLCVGKNIGVILTIHDINLAARFADKIVFMKKLVKDFEGQQVLAGTVSELFTSENLLKTFGVELQTYQHPIYNCIQIYEK